MAFLVGGIARGFDRERIRRALMKHVVEPLAPSPKHRDLIFVLKVMNSTRSEQNLTDEIEADYNTLKRGVEALQPRATSHFNFAPVDDDAILHPSGSPSAAQGLRLHPSRGTCFDLKRLSVRGYLSTIRRALMLMEAREKQRGARYDVAVFLRPDLLHLQAVPHWCDPLWAGVLGGKEMRTIGADFMYVMPRIAAGLMLEVIEHDMTTYAAKGMVQGVPVSSCSFAAVESLGNIVADRMRTAGGSAVGEFRVVSCGGWVHACVHGRMAG